MQPGQSIATHHVRMEELEVESFVRDGRRLIGERPFGVSVRDMTSGRL